MQRLTRLKKKNVDQVKMSFVADISGVWTLFQKHSEISRCFTQHSPHHFCIVKLSLWLPSRDQMESKQD